MYVCMHVKRTPFLIEPWMVKDASTWNHQDLTILFLRLSFNFLIPESLLVCLSVCLSINAWQWQWQTDSLNNRSASDPSLSYKQKKIKNKNGTRFIHPSGSVNMSHVYTGSCFFYFLLQYFLYLSVTNVEKSNFCSIYFFLFNTRFCLKLWLVVSSSTSDHLGPLQFGPSPEFPIRILKKLYELPYFLM